MTAEKPESCQICHGNSKAFLQGSVPELEARTPRNSKQLFPSLLLHRAKSKTWENSRGSDGCGGLKAVMEQLPFLHTYCQGRSRQALPGQWKAPGSRLAWLQRYNTTEQQKLKFLICRLEAATPEAIFVACSCSTEIRAINHGLLSCWQLEVTGENSQGMALSDEGLCPALWEQRCAALVRELKTSGKEKSSVSFELISFSMFGSAAFAHGKCFDRLLLWGLFGLFFFSSPFLNCEKS